MGKTSNDEEYGAQVHNGQRGGFLDDFVQSLCRDGSLGSKGYDYGAEHRYDSKGNRYHTWDGKGINDLSSKSPEKSKNSSTNLNKVNDRGYSSSSLYSSTKDGREPSKDEGWGLAILLASLISLGALLTFNICERTYRKAEITRQERILQENHRIKRLSYSSEDYSYFPDKLSFAISRPLKTYSEWGSEILRDNIFLVSRDRATINLESLVGDSRIIHEIESEDHVAPMISLDGRRIAFSVTRRDHPPCIYVMEFGKSIKRVSDFYGSLAFGWLSNNKLFLWGSYEEGADISNLSSYKKGKSFLIDTQYGLNQTQEINQIPDTSFQLKLVSGSNVSYFYVE